MRSISPDLRRRIVDACLFEEGTRQEIAFRFCVSLSTVTRLLRLRRETGKLLPRPHAGGRARSLSTEQEQVLSKIAMAMPRASLEELREELKRRTGTNVSVTTMWRALRKLGWGRKRAGGRRRRPKDILRSTNKAKAQAKAKALPEIKDSDIRNLDRWWEKVYRQALRGREKERGGR